MVAAHDFIRAAGEALREDRPQTPDTETFPELGAGCSVIERVEAVVGPMEPGSRG